MTIEVKTYTDLEKYVSLLKCPGINLLIVSGRAGTGKTTILNKALQNALILKGHLTPMELYINIYKEKPEFVIIDDVDQLFRSNIMTSLLKQLTDTGVEKTLSYSSSQVVRQGLPREYDISFIKGVAIITNRNMSETTAVHLKAIMNRAIAIDFNPCMLEINNVAKSFVSKQTLNFARDFCLVEVSLRSYTILNAFILNDTMNPLDYIGDIKTTYSDQELRVASLLFQTSNPKEARQLFDNGRNFDVLYSRVKNKRIEYDTKVNSRIY